MHIRIFLFSRHNICNIISPFPFCICEFVFNRVLTCAPREIFNFSVRSYIIKELKITIILFDFFFFLLKIEIRRSSCIFVSFGLFSFRNGNLRIFSNRSLEWNLGQEIPDIRFTRWCFAKVSREITDTWTCHFSWRCRQTSRGTVCRSTLCTLHFSRRDRQTSCGCSPRDRAANKTKRETRK